MTKTSTLKQRIRNGEEIRSFGANIDIERSELEAHLANDTYDQLYVDGQHEAFSENQLVSFCAMAEELGLPVQFRIPHTREAHLVGRYLDLGPTTIVVPEVEDVATVDEAVRFAYYPPLGRRSWGGTARHGLKSMGDKVSRRDYAQWWNEHVVLGIMLESVDAIVNARTLANQPGVDFVSFGPNDLQFSLEQHPEFPLKSIRDCMENVADQLKDTQVQVRMGLPASFTG